MNYYELFDLPVSPSVDQKLVAKKYIELQRKSHPDFYQNALENEKEEVMLHSAEINKGYKILKDPQLTIEYFLITKGAIQTDEKYSLPPDFLMEMMDLNELMLEKGGSDVTEKVKTFEDSIFGSVRHLLQSTTVEWSEEDLQKLKEYYYKKKYLERILDRLDE